MLAPEQQKANAKASAIDDSRYDGSSFAPFTPEELVEIIRKCDGEDAFAERAFRYQQCGAGAWECESCGNLLEHHSQIESMLCSRCSGIEIEKQI